MHILSLGAGVQSSTMALMAAHGEITPMPAAAIFADTGAEPASVYKWLDWLEQQLPYPVYRVKQGDLSVDELTIRRSKRSGRLYRRSLIPAYGQGAGILGRKCTRDYKITPIFRKAKEIASVPRHRRLGVYVTQWIGISLDEASRMKPSRESWAVNIWPLIDAGMSRSDCLRWMSDRGYPTPPRSACVFCPFHSDKEWLRLKNDEPEEFERAVEFEKRLQDAYWQDEVSTALPFLHSKRIPLSLVKFTESDTRQSSLFENECEGMCGV